MLAGFVEGMFRGQGLHFVECLGREHLGHGTGFAEALNFFLQ